MKKVHSSACKVRVCFCHLLMKLGFSFWKVSNFLKIRQVGADLFHADRQTDRHEANSRFSQFLKEPKNTAFSHIVHSHDYTNILVTIMSSGWFMLLRIKGARYSHAFSCDIQLILSTECLGISAASKRTTYPRPSVPPNRSSRKINQLCCRHFLSWPFDLSRNSLTQQGLGWSEVQLSCGHCPFTAAHLANMCVSSNTLDSPKYHRIFNNGWSDIQIKMHLQQLGHVGSYITAPK